MTAERAGPPTGHEAGPVAGQETGYEAGRGSGQAADQQTGHEAGRGAGPRSWAVEGLAAGLIGYLTVAVFFGLLNAVSGEGLFHTASVLGSALFFGIRDPSGMVEGPAPVIAYNGLHLLVSFLIGLAAAWLIDQTEKARALWYPVFFIFLAGFIFSVVVVGILAAELTHLLSWGAVVAANAAAGVTAGGYLWWRHRGLVGRLARE